MPPKWLTPMENPFRMEIYSFSPGKSSNWYWYNKNVAMEHPLKMEVLLRKSTILMGNFPLPLPEGTATGVSSSCKDTTQHEGLRKLGSLGAFA